MTETFFEEPDENSSVDPLVSIVDDGSNSTKFFNDQLSSFNFDGIIPTITEELSVTQLQEGMSFSLDGGTTFYQITELERPDEDFEEFATTEYTLIYSDETKQTQEVVLNETDTVIAIYEDWSEKVIGTTGWLITSQGNAIFSNIAARGRIEATDGFLENLDISGNLNIETNGSISIGSSIVIDSNGIVGSDGVNETFNLDSSGNLTLLGTITGATIAGDVIFENSGGLGGLGQIATNENVESNGGIYMDDTGLYAYNSLGAQTFSINADTGEVTITGYAEGNLDDYVEENELYNPGTTTISGGRIRTGVIQSESYSGVTDGSTFSSNGLSINLNTGAFTGESFRIDSGGNAEFKGRIQALSGYFGNQTYGITIGDNGSQVGLETTTLKLGSSNVGGVTYGSINFYTTTGTSLGSIAATNSNKSWSFFGNGVGYGTSSDYFLLPSTGNSNRSRFVGSGFNWYDASLNLLMSIAGGSGQLQIYRNTNIQTGYTLTTNGITNSTNGITNNGGQITSLPTYNNSAALTNNVHITTAGVFRRNSSNQKNKHSIIALSDSPFGESVLKNKILDGEPNINYLNILNITPVEFKTIEDGVKTNRTLLGFIADDIADKVPEIATYDENGVPEYYDVNAIVSGLLAVVQNQQKEINELQNKLNVIEERLGV